MLFRRESVADTRVLIIVQNLPVPLDRRVWLECQALVASGYGVSVICPKGLDDPSTQEIDGVRIYKYAPPKAAHGVVSYLHEFIYCWLRTGLLSVKVLFRDGFSIIQACNPPDTYWALAGIYKLFGKRFVYDQHDLNPELFLSRFGEPAGWAARLQHATLLWLERSTFRTADRVISTNESYKRIAIERGGRDPQDVTVVRSGPNTARMRPIDGVPALRRGRDYLLVYLGVMGPQDGVDLVLRVLDVIVHTWDRHDVHVALLGFGDCYDELVALAHELDIDGYVTFTGSVGPADIARYLSTADIGISPDPLSPLNEVSTMNKTMEYMSYALPVVAFDLAETRVSGGDAVEYVENGTSVDRDAVERFATQVVKLLDDEERRADLALAGRRRAETVLDWAPQRAAYVGVFDELSNRESTISADFNDNASLAPTQSGELVDVTDDDALREFGRTRRRRVRPLSTAS